MTDQISNSAETVFLDSSDGRATAKKHGSALETVLHLSEALSKDSFPNDGERVQAVLALQDLTCKLETSWETVSRICITQPALHGALKVTKDLDLFVKWHKCGGKPMTAGELADMVGAEAEFLTRLLRHLATNHVLDENSHDVFHPNDFTTALVQPVVGEWIEYLYDISIPCFFKLPEYVAKKGYKSPTDPCNGVFQYTKAWAAGDLFAYYDAHPRESATFNNILAGVMANQAGWVDIIPRERIFASDTAATAATAAIDLEEDGGGGAPPLLVDVGGNIGQDVNRFCAKYPDAGGADRLLYLQDRANVISLAKCDDSVKKMVYDFFMPQPVQGARIYFMHSVLHDWSDAHARKILENQRVAMRPGYSKLLLQEHVLADGARAHPQATAYDLTMMVHVAGSERSEAAWRALLASAGFRIVKIWRSPLAVQSVIEAEPVVAENIS